MISQVEFSVTCRRGALACELIALLGADLRLAQLEYDITCRPMDPVTNLLDYLRIESSEAEWATARSKRDRFQDSRNAACSTVKSEAKPQALLERYCAEGKIARNHLDERCGHSLCRFFDHVWLA